MLLCPKEFILPNVTQRNKSGGSLRGKLEAAGLKSTVLRAVWNEGAAHIVTALYRMSGECWFVFRSLPFKAPVLSALYLFHKWKWNQIQDREAQSPCNTCLDNLHLVPLLAFVFPHFFSSFFWARDELMWGRNDSFNKKDLWMLPDPETFEILH